jgi:hypothetical protein
MKKPLNRIILCAAAFAFAVAGIAQAQQRTMGLILHDSTRSYQGYTVFSPLFYDVNYLIDNEGRLVHTWSSDYVPGAVTYLLEDGSLLRASNIGNPVFTAGGTGGRVEMTDWNGDVSWRFDYSSDTNCQHHDVEIMPNGNVLMVAWEYKTRSEALAAGRDPALLDEALWPDKIIEVDPDTDSIVWEWRTWDHLVQDFDSTKENYGVVSDHPELLDLNYILTDHEDDPDIHHVNSVAYNADLDQIIISSRSFTEFWVVDHQLTTEEARGHTAGRYGKGGDLLYRWGNVEAYGRGDSTDQLLFYQHDPRWIADSLPGAGNILVFSNGHATRRTWSSVDEIVPRMHPSGYYPLGPDTVYGPSEAAWWYRDTIEFYGSFISGCQRLPNGNTLICDGPRGRFLEVTPDSAVVWKYICPVCSIGPMHQGESIPGVANAVFRCYRYSPDFAGFQGRNMTPGSVIELPPGVAERGRLFPRASGLEVLPSAARDRVSFGFRLSGEDRAVLAVFDSQGRLVEKVLDETRQAGEHRIPWQAGELPAGTYFCRLTAEAASVTRRFTLVR